MASLAGQGYDSKMKLNLQGPAARNSTMSLQDTVNLLRDSSDSPGDSEQLDPEWSSEFQDVRVTVSGDVLTESVVIKDKPKSIENTIALYLCAHATKDPAKPSSITPDHQSGIYKVTYIEVLTNVYSVIWFDKTGKIISSMKAASL